LVNTDYWLSHLLSMHEVFSYIFGLVPNYTNCDLLWFFSVPLGR